MLKKLKHFFHQFKPVDVEKNQMLISEYWEKEKIRKIAEAKITKHPPGHYATEGDKIMIDIIIL